MWSSPPHRGAADQRLMMLVASILAAVFVVIGVVLLLGPRPAASPGDGGGVLVASEPDGPGLLIEGLEGFSAEERAALAEFAADSPQGELDEEAFWQALPEHLHDQAQRFLDSFPDDQQDEARRVFLAYANHRYGDRADAEASEEVTDEEEEDDDEHVQMSGILQNQDNVPIPDALVRVHGSGYSESARTNPEGVFQLTLPKSGPGMIEVQPPAGIDYRPFEPVRFDSSRETRLVGNHPSGGSVRSVAQSGRQAPIMANLVLFETGDRLRGTVIDDATDEPIEGATIEGSHRYAVGEMAFSYTTGPNGEFEIDGLTNASRIHTVTFSHLEYEPETRRDLRAFDGTQTIRLKQHNRLELLVTWGSDGAPVTHYSYRLLLISDMNDTPVDVGRADKSVTSGDGRTVLENVHNGRWRAEVAVLDPEGAPTDIRSSADFDFVEGGQARTVEVVVESDLAIRGRVRVPNAASGAMEPTSGAVVEIIPPVRYRAAEQDYVGHQMNLDSAVTDSNGEFEFRGVTPGIVSIVASYGSRRTYLPIDVEVQVGESPPYLQIDLEEGGIMEGVVRLPEGENREGVRITMSRAADNFDGFTGQTTLRTNSMGEFRADGLGTGVWFVWAYPPNRAAVMRSVEVATGTVANVEFDFATEVRLHGNIRVIGESSQVSGRRIEFTRVGAGRHGTGSVSPAGDYSVRISPGRYMTRLSPGVGEGPIITVEDWPEEQRRDLEFSLNRTDVIVIFPEGETFHRGQVVVQPRETSNLYDILRVDMTQEHRHLPDLLGGEYQATFQSSDRRWRGQSGFVTIGPGLANTFEIEARAVLENERIGGWDPDTISTSLLNKTFPVGHLVDEPGLYEVLIRYDRGRHAVETVGASFVSGQAGLASAFHQGWSGADHYNNAYLLHLDGVPEDGNIAVEVIMRSDGGTDSTGTVYLSRLD